MSELNITEYSSLLQVNGNPVMVGGEPSIKAQTVEFSLSPGESSVFHPATGLVRLVSDTDCRILIGTDPSVTESGTILPAGLPEYFGVRKGESHKISVVQL